MTRRIASLLLVSCIIVGGATTRPAAADSISNGKIVFSRYDPKTDMDLPYTVDPDGTDEQAVGTGELSCGSWSPDGTTLLVCASPNGLARPATADPDGSNVQILDRYPQRDLWLPCSYWSPDGSRFLCSANYLSDPRGFGLYTVRSSDGGGLLRLTTTPLGFSDSALGYAPNGRHILFFRENLTTFTSTLYVVRADGSHPVRLSPKSVGVLDLDFNDGAAGSWAPDSSHVAFAGIAKQGGGTATGLYVVGIDGRGFTRITPPGMGALSASWSPTGSWIAYSSNLHGDTQVYISHPDGSGRRQLTYPVGGYAIGLTPMWSPDGRWLLFQRGYWKEVPVSYDLAIVGIAGGAITHVADLPGWTSYRWGTAPPTN